MRHTNDRQLHAIQQPLFLLLQCLSYSLPCYPWSDLQFANSFPCSSLRTYQNSIVCPDDSSPFNHEAFSLRDSFLKDPSYAVRTQGGTRSSAQRCSVLCSPHLHLLSVHISESSHDRTRVPRIACKKDRLCKWINFLRMHFAFYRFFPARCIDRRNPYTATLTTEGTRLLTVETWEVKTRWGSRTSNRAVSTRCCRTPRTARCRWTLLS